METTLEPLLQVLAHGDDNELAARIYAAESLSPAARSIPLGLLRALRAPSPAVRLEVDARHGSGRFELVVLRVPWNATPDDPVSAFHPLIVAPQHDQYRAVGFVLPWNEIIPMLEAERAELHLLSAIWIQRVLALRGSVGAS